MHKQNEEPILSESDDRFVVFPIAYQKIWQHYKDAHVKFWTSEQFDYTEDQHDWKSLLPAEVALLSQIIAFLAAYTRVLNEILVTKFASEVKIPEARAFYGFQIAIMNIHLEVFSVVIDLCEKDKDIKKKIANLSKINEVCKSKLVWVGKRVDSLRIPFSARIVAYACAESIFMAGAFATIFYLSEREMCLNLTEATKLIKNDKNMHVDFSCEIHNTLLMQCSNDNILEIVKEAVEIEKGFISKTLSTNSIGLDSELVKDYIEFVGDELLTKFNNPKHYNTINPLKFMDEEKEKGDKNDIDCSVISLINEDDEFKIEESF